MNLPELFHDLYGVDRPRGCTEEEIAAVRERFGALPAAVEDFWRMAGHLRGQYNQDDWIFPEDVQKPEELEKEDYFILLVENQGVCRAGIRREDLILPDPPVYTRMEDDDPWLLCAPTVSGFLEAALTYEAIWGLKYSAEEYVWLTGGEAAVLRENLEKRPCALNHWMDLAITFYSNRPDNLVVVMDAGDHCEALYGAATQESYAALLEVMEGLGEPL